MNAGCQVAAPCRDLQDGFSGETGLDQSRSLSWCDPWIKVAHHSHVLVSIVVTMEHERPLERPESHQQFHNAVAGQIGRIVFVCKCCRGRATVETDQLVRFQMNMNWMPPATTVIPEDPLLSGADSRSCIGAVRVIKLLIHLPRTITTVEVKGPHGDGISRIEFFVVAKCCCRVNGGTVGLWFTLNDELHERHGRRKVCSLSEAAIWTASVILRQNVVEVEFRRGVGEVNDDIGPVCGTQQHRGFLDRMRQEPRVLSDPHERLAVAEFQFKKTGVTAVQNAKPVFASFNFEEGLSYAINQPDIAKMPVVIEGVKGE